MPWDELAEELSAARTAPLTTSVIRAAEEATLALAYRSAGVHRLPIVDHLLAAAAQETAAAVPHYDRGYDTLAEVWPSNRSRLLQQDRSRSARAILELFEHRPHWRRSSLAQMCFRPRPTS
jgi:hypothetical protein